MVGEETASFISLFMAAKTKKVTFCLAVSQKSINFAAVNGKNEQNDTHQLILLRLLLLLCSKVVKR